jgi:hypothetical protein
VRTPVLSTGLSRQSSTRPWAAVPVHGVSASINCPAGYKACTCPVTSMCTTPKERCCANSTIGCAFDATCACNCTVPLE